MLKTVKLCLDIKKPKRVLKSKKVSKPKTVKSRKKTRKRIYVPQPIKNAVPLAVQISNIVRQSGVTIPNSGEQFKRKESVVPRGFGGAVPKYLTVKSTMEEYLKKQTKDRSIFFDILLSDLTLQKYRELVWNRDWVRYKYKILVRLHTSKRKRVEQMLNLQNTKKDMLNEYMKYFVDNAKHTLIGFSKQEIKVTALKSLYKANQISRYDSKRPHKKIWCHCMLGFLTELKFAKDTNQDIDVHDFDGARFYDFEFGGKKYELKFLNNERLNETNPVINRTSSGYSKIQRESWNHLVIYTDTPNGIKYHGHINIADYKKHADILSDGKIVIHKKYINRNNLIQTIVTPL